MKTERNSSISTGVARPDCVICAARCSRRRGHGAGGRSGRSRRTGQSDHESQAHVGALLGDELAQLPAIDGQRRWSPPGVDGAPASGGEAATLLIGSAPAALWHRRRRGTRAAGAPLSWSRSSGRTGPRAWPARAESARIPMPAVRARARARRRRFLGLEVETVLASLGVGDAGPCAQDLKRVHVSVVRRR